jgi:hypothetical protein
MVSMDSHLKIRLLAGAANHIMLLRHGAIENAAGFKRFIAQSTASHLSFKGAKPMRSVDRFSAHRWPDCV